jgi:acetyl esterase
MVQSPARRQEAPVTLDPHAKLVLDMVAASGRPPFEKLSVDEARQLYRDSRRALSPEPREVAEVQDLLAPGPGGPIPIRQYRPTGGRLPALVYFHGGGWVIGGIDTHDVVCRHLALAGGCAVFSVDYRLAPEHKFPAAVDDAFAATRWIAEQAEKLGIDAGRLAVGGDSAGGNLAAVVSLLARDNGGPRIALQLLLYPATHLGGDFESQRRCADGYLLTRKGQDWFENHYLRRAEDRLDWRASPLLAKSHRGLPPAWILTCGYDPLADEGAAYARRLEESGGAAVHRSFPGQIHGFLTMGKMIAQTAVALDEAGAALKRMSSGA